MKLTKPVKIILGLATALNILSPLLGIIIWFTVVFSVLIPAESIQGGESWMLFIFFFVFFPLIMLAGLSSLVLLPVYLVHIIKNKPGRDLYRILAAIGLHYLPWVAMPFYFLVYIWPENPPAWALGEPVLPASSPPAEPEPEPEPPLEAVVPPEDAGTSEPEIAPQSVESEESVQPPETPVDATVVSWESPAAPEPVVDAPEHSEALPAVEEPGETVISSAKPEEPEPEEKPAPKPTRKRASRAKTKPPAEETPASADATMIGPSPIEEQPGDES